MQNRVFLRVFFSSLEASRASVRPATSVELWRDRVGGRGSPQQGVLARHDLCHQEVGRLLDV